MFGRKKTKPARILLLDGPLRPNDLLENAEARPLENPDDMCVAPDGSLLVSSGCSLLRLRDWAQDAFDPVAEFSSDVSALACRDDGLIAVGLKGAGIRVLTPDGGVAPGWVTLEGSTKDIRAKDIRACRFDPDGTLLVANASDGRGSDTQDLFKATGSGQILRLGQDGGCETVLGGLRFPYGLTQTGAGKIIVSESWAARLCEIMNDGSPRAIMQDAPGYPARINPTSDGGYILSLFARRDPLIEFLQSEPDFLNRMTSEIDPEYWIAPRLSADKDYRIPTQLGATRLFGETKPWAPSLSYGLVIRLDGDFTPMASAQSRANGVRHGITSALEWNGNLIALSKGSNLLLKVTDMDHWT